MSTLQDSLAAIKDIAKLFAPLATVSADIDRVSALVAHEDELKESIADKLNEKAQIDAEIATRISAADAEIAASKKAQADTAAGYAARNDELNVEYQAAKTAARVAIDQAKADVATEQETCGRQIANLRAACDAERTTISADHAAFIESTKQHRAQIEANTAALQDTLNKVRAELAPLMKDDQE